MNWFLYDNGLRHERVKLKEGNIQLQFFKHFQSIVYLDEPRANI